MAKRAPATDSATNSASEPQESIGPQALTVTLTAYPESNGRRNWTAMFVRIAPFKGLVGTSGGVTVQRGEHWNRVAYYAERARLLVGERATEPDLMAYAEDINTPQEWTGEDPEGIFHSLCLQRYAGI